MKAGNVISFGDLHSTNLRKGFQGTVNACRQLLIKALPSLIGDHFDRLDDELYRLAEEAPSNQQQEMFLGAMRFLRSEREQIESGFIKGLLLRFDHFWRHGYPQPEGLGGVDSPEQEMGLIERDALEEGLAITSMVSKNNNRFYRDLYALDRRFSYLLNGARIPENGNPLSPAVICETFRQSLSGVDLQVRLMVYRVFEKQVLGQLGDLYDQANALLAKAGVLPDIKPVIRTQSGYRDQAGSSRSLTESRSSDSEVESGESSRQGEIFATLQRLLEARRPASNDAESGDRSVAALQLLDALTAVQHQQDNTYEVMDAGALRAVLMQMPAIGSVEDKPHSLKRADDDAIDVISMLFEFILDDPGLSDGMRALLARLQIPMLKVAILDKQFFSRKAHPARRLLNLLAQSAVGWTEASGREGDGLYHQIESVVNRVLTEFDDDLGIFEELCDQFSAYLEREHRSVLVAEERAAQVTKGREALIAAKQHVAEEIGRCFSRYYAVPDVAQNLVRDAWNDVLLLIYLRKGSESEEWSDAVKLMERLVWSVMPKRSAKERQKLLRTIPELLKGLREGLSEISYSPHKMNRAFKGLQARHLVCLRGGRAVEEASQQNQSESSQVMEEIVLASPVQGSEPVSSSATDEAAERAPDQYDAWSDQLAAGDWLQFTDEQDQVTRAKLSWRSGVTGTCLFVNRKGLKVAEVSGGELADWLRRSKAEQLPPVDRPLMDRALNRMVERLSRATGGGGVTTDGDDLF